MQVGLRSSYRRPNMEQVMERQKFAIVSPAFTLTKVLVKEEPSLANLDEVFKEIAYVPTNEVGSVFPIYTDKDLAEKGLILMRHLLPQAQWFHLRIANLAILKKLVKMAEANGVSHVGIDLEKTPQGIAGLVERIDRLERPRG